MTERTRRQVHLAAHFPGVNNTTVWSDPAAGSNIEFDSFEHMARTAERGLFDFFFLAEGLRLREHKGRVFDLDTVGRPETVSILAALAQVTEHLGLAGTLSSTYNEPYDLARKLGTLDLVSGGRAAWNVVTSNDAFTGANFRRGGYLDYADRYRRAEDFISTARTLWESRVPAIGPGDGSFSHRSEFFDIAGTFGLPPLPQGHPVVFQAGDSPAGRDFAAGSADVVFTRHTGIEAGAAFVADLRARAAGYGREPGSLKIFPGVTFAIGDTAAEAEERSRHIRYQQVSPAGAIAFLEQLWGRDLTAYDPDGPLPDVEPDVDPAAITRGRVRHIKDPRPTIAAWRELAAARHLSIRDLVVEVSARHSFVGTPATIAEQLDAYVQAGAADGFILVPHLTPGGLDEFVDRVVPELQNRGVYRDAYHGTTLRDNLGLPRFRPEAEWTAARSTTRAATTELQEVVS
ncbi:LLM class flavin-dependent oxidoreductase [Brevibacterium sp. 91QC2O2]|uniref:LLM class flavin-dependent oxidoreductase n=1 Tax=Brevibacterium TaxID=1696 RepID=UPI00211CDD48|nr:MULTISPECIES: LLM class flavin-dependent oxidoreductase [unclassified Brevibacterium]MCQ9367824.1 LLM class flavin-dependent oxidoreductase [Brevibacterium sp. 91QC2O2]MCQ9384871.1 LLM class flavin-dependent oxidoreductase [Brevibacterium sp. 68QC2CO]